jgi:hypothetical protein
MMNHMIVILGFLGEFGAELVVEFAERLARLQTGDRKLVVLALEWLKSGLKEMYFESEISHEPGQGQGVTLAPAVTRGVMGPIKQLVGQIGHSRPW